VQLQNVGRGPGGNAPVVTEMDGEEAGRHYKVYYYAGRWKRVPEDWRFPRCGVFDAWWQWWIGDHVRQVPPLRNLEAPDVCHLNGIAIGEDEMHGRAGPRDRRRLARKTLNDLKFLMKWVAFRVHEAGATAHVITIASVDRMFLSVAPEFSEGERDGQKKWNTVVNELRKKKVSFPKDLVLSI